MTGVIGWSQRLWCKSQRLWYPYDFSVSPRPLGFGFLSFWVGGLRVWGLGLTITYKWAYKILLWYKVKWLRASFDLWQGVLECSQDAALKSSERLVNFIKYLMKFLNKRLKQGQYIHRTIIVMDMDRIKIKATIKQTGTDRSKFKTGDHITALFILVYRESSLLIWNWI